MKLTILTENTACSPSFQAVHGLSLYLETRKHRILMDVGPGEEFLHNGGRLGIDLSQVDLCAISHGHNDHGGGLEAFLRENHTAPIYLSSTAFGDCYAGTKYIGLNKALASHPQLHFVEDVLHLDDQVTLLTRIPGDTLLPKANANLNGPNGPDDFQHEMVMLVEEDGTLLLLGGCAHRGIVNILEYAKSVAGRYPDAVVSGFHLAAGGRGDCLADDNYLDELSARLMATGAYFFSCHCTGLEALLKLQPRMPGHRVQLSAGMGVEF